MVVGLVQLPSHAAVSYNQYYDSKQYPQEYLLQFVVGDGDRVEDSVLCPFVHNLQALAPSALTRTFPLDGPVYEEHAGFREKRFRLQGRSGFSEYYLGVFHKFRNFLEKVQEKQKQNRNAFVRGVDYKLILNFAWEGEAYYCSIVQFAYIRDKATSRLSFEWSLDLVTNGVVGGKWRVPDNLKAYLDGGADADAHWLATHPCHRRAAAALAGASQETKAAVGDDVLNMDVLDESPLQLEVLDESPQIDQVIEVRGGLDQTVNSLATSRTSGAGFDFGLQRDLYTQATDKSARLYDAWDDFDSLQRAEQRWNVMYILGWLSDLYMGASASLGYVFERVWDQPVPANALPRPRRPLPNLPQPMAAWTTTGGDQTAFDVAAAATGSRNNWRAIVDLNGMLDARTNGDGSFLGPGQVLLYPLEGGLTGGSEDLYGTDLLVRDGDLVANGDDDILLVGGLENLTQNIGHRILTTRGENPAFPQFGLQKIVGEKTTENFGGAVLSDIKTQVTADHRVFRLLELRIDTTGDVVTATFNVEAVTRARTGTITAQHPGIS